MAAPPKRQRSAAEASPSPKRQRPAADAPRHCPHLRLMQKGSLQRLSLPGGVLDDSILGRVAAIAQQSNCVGCDGRGLAEGVAKKLPYGCSYRDRRRQPPANRFAVPEDRATPGTIDVRRPPPALCGSSARPMVINMFAQWEMGAAGKYNRIQPSPPSDSAATREGWFRTCLGAIAALRLPSIAFPHEIGCGLAGGRWATYEAMLEEFAEANTDTEVLICRWTGGGGGGRGRGGRGVRNPRGAS